MRGALGESLTSAGACDEAILLLHTAVTAVTDRTAFSSKSSDLNHNITSGTFID